MLKINFAKFYVKRFIQCNSNSDVEKIIDVKPVPKKPMKTLISNPKTKPKSRGIAYFYKNYIKCLINAYRFFKSFYYKFLNFLFLNF